MMVTRTPKVSDDLRSVLTGAFIIAGALLAYEIVLTRLLSVLLSCHFVFGVLSLALMGQGVGALYLVIRRARHCHPGTCRQRLALRAALCAYSMALAATLVAVLGTITSWAPIYLVVVAPPFFLGGIFFADIFQCHLQRSPWVYGADLMGAGSGCAGIILLLHELSALQSLFAIALLVYLAAVVFSHGSGRQLYPSLQADDARQLQGASAVSVVALALPLLLLFCASLTMDSLRTIPVGGNPDKEITDALRQGRVQETRWSAFGQTDLIQYPLNNGRKDIYIDGTAGTPMYRFSGNWTRPGDSVADLMQSFPGILPLQFLTREEKDNALIIGPGGGRDVLLTLAAGFDDIDAIDVNPDIVALVKAHADYNGGIYTSMKNVHIFVGEGRSFLKRQEKFYDLIFMSLPATNSSRSRQGVALTENFLLTVEAIGDYLDHLTPEGRLVVVTHGEVEALRLLSVALGAFERRHFNVPAAMQHMVLIGHADYPVLVLQKRCASSRQMAALMRGLSQSDYDPFTSFVPALETTHGVHPALLALSQGRLPMADIMSWAEKRGYDLSVVTDNRPYFFKFAPGLPQVVQWISGLGGSLAGLIVAAMVWGYRLKHRVQLKMAFQDGDRPLGGRLVCMTVLFALLGAGFMVVEMSLAQQSFLFIGQPVLSIAIILWSLLGGGGLGAVAARCISDHDLDRALCIHSLVIAGMLGGLYWTLPILFSIFLGEPLCFRLGVIALSMGGLGFILGFPFPLALRLLRHWQLDQWVPWMLALNGISSVLGAAFCVAVMTCMGTAHSLWMAMFFYGFAGVLVKFNSVYFKRSSNPSQPCWRLNL